MLLLFSRKNSHNISYTFFWMTLTHRYSSIIHGLGFSFLQLRSKINASYSWWASHHSWKIKEAKNIYTEDKPSMATKLYPNRSLDVYYLSGLQFYHQLPKSVDPTIHTHRRSNNRRDRCLWIVSISMDPSCIDVCWCGWGRRKGRGWKS